MNFKIFQPTLIGENITLFPLEPSHFDELYLAASDPLIWEGHPNRNRYEEQEFIRWFESALESKALVIKDNLSGKLIGSSRYYEFDQNKSEISIGYTFLTRDHWGGKTNRELKTLMLDHAFEYVTTVWFHVDQKNIRSQKAMLKIGAVESHVEDKFINGRLAKYVFYKMEKNRLKNISIK